jgi:hypothetical protein
MIQGPTLTRAAVTGAADRGGPVGRLVPATIRLMWLLMVRALWE